MEGLKIRTLLPRDVPHVVAITQASPEAAQWAAADFERLADGAGEEVQTWVAENGGAVAGHLVLRMAGDEAEILNVAVAHAARRRGIASALISTALAAAEARRAQRVFLEVRESNRAAVRLYQRHQFRLAGKRPRYYREPTEDALVLAREVGAATPSDSA